MQTIAEQIMQTTAEQIAEILDNDGTRWASDSGITLSELARTRGAYVDYATLSYDEDGYPVASPSEDGKIPDLVRYGFVDGSAIVVGQACWDIEGPAPWSFAGA